jgi:hypothetical protein
MFTKEVLAALNVSEGDTLFVTSVPGGIKLSRGDDHLAAQLEAGRAFARDYAETLKALGK